MKIISTVTLSLSEMKEALGLYVASKGFEPDTIVVSSYGRQRMGIDMSEPNGFVEGEQFRHQADSPT